jgi:hypothetical protein
VLALSADLKKVSRCQRRQNTQENLSASWPNPRNSITQLSQSARHKARLALHQFHLGNRQFVGVANHISIVKRKINDVRLAGRQRGVRGVGRDDSG